MKTAGVVALIAWAVGMFISAEIGLLDAFAGNEAGELHRVEYLLPGYRIGYWLGETP